MSRGFQLANIDVGLLTDPKLLKLARLVPDEGERGCTILVYLQTVLQSWQDGGRLTVAEAEGLWEATPERISALAAARLIDDEQRIPEQAWAWFFIPALQRTEQRREAGRQGGLASGKRRKQRSSDASAPPQRRPNDGEAALDLTPADAPSPEGEAGVGRAGMRVEDAPARPPRMDHLDEADTHAIETMLRELPPNAGRRGLLRAELAARAATDLGATPKGATDARHEAPADGQVDRSAPPAPSLAVFGPFRVRVDGPASEPVFDPALIPRYDRGPSSADAASLFDLEDRTGPSPTSRAMSR